MATATIMSIEKMIEPEEARRVRTQRRVTQEEIANLIGVARNTYSLWENGSRSMPRTALVALAGWVAGTEMPDKLVSLAEERIARACDDMAGVMRSTDLDRATKVRILRSALNIIRDLVTDFDRAKHQE